MPGRFSGVKVFSATMLRDRDELGDKVTAWIAARPQLDVVDMVVTQSSDAQFHCIAITLFYNERPAAQPGARRLNFRGGQDGGRA